MNVTPKETRLLVFDCLKKPRSYDHVLQHQTLCKELAPVFKNRGLMLDTVQAWHDNRAGGPTLHPTVEVWVQDIIWDLIVEGIIRPGKGGSHPGTFPEFHLTPHGKQVLASEVNPYDPDGYVDAVKKLVPKVDPVIVAYIAESSIALRRNCFLAATITLGCASEKAILLLIEKYKNSLNPTNQANFSAVIDKKHQVKPKHDELMKWYRQHLEPKLKSAGKSADWLRYLQSILDSVFQHFRISRNDAGHPTGETFAREEVHASLVLFPSYIQHLYELMNWLDANPGI